MKSNKHPTEILKQIAIFTLFIANKKAYVYYAINLASINIGGVWELKQTGICTHQLVTHRETDRHLLMIDGL